MSLESIPKSLPADSHLPISEASRQMVNQFIKRSNGRQEAMVEIYIPPVNVSIPPMSGLDIVEDLS